VTICSVFRVRARRQFPLPAYLTGGHDTEPSKPPVEDSGDLGDSNRDYWQTEVRWAVPGAVAFACRTFACSGNPRCRWTSVGETPTGVYLPGRLVHGGNPMDALELMLSRESAIRLEAPGPSADELDRIFASAVRAPDHGRLRPWQFVVIPEDRRAAFGALMADCLKRRNPDVSDVELKREREKAFRSPVIVAVAAKVQRGHKIPEIEQIASAAAAAQTIMLAAPALGYGAWTVALAAPGCQGIRHHLGGLATPRPAASSCVPSPGAAGRRSGTRRAPSWSMGATGRRRR
jgi:hypothetical protein